MCATLLILFGIIGKISGLFLTIPNSVLGERSYDGEKHDTFGLQTSDLGLFYVSR
jgi:hypothetical protein